MASSDDLASIASSSAFIFTASTSGSLGAEADTERSTVVVSVRDVMKAPIGMGGLAAREVTVRLRQPLSEGHYVFFADLVSVGSTITVSETAHLDESQREDAVEAIQRGYAEALRPRLEAAWLVALGTIGEVTAVFAPLEQAGRVPWALGRLDIERVLKGPKSRRRMTLIGPATVSKRLPRTPALRPGLYAIMLLQRPPEEAMEHVPERERQATGFIAETSDIQPSDRAEDLERILRAGERE
jgi:hypothetical protein